MRISPRFLVLIALVAAGCGDGGTDPVVPAALTPVSQASLTGAVGTALDTISVRVLDSNNKPMRNVQVAWAVTSGGGSVSASATATDAQGTAEVVWTLGTMAGENKLSASVSGLSPIVFTANANAGPPASMTVVAGADQVAVVGTQVTIPPAVEVKDAHGNLVAGATVSFVATTGGGVANAGAQSTNAQGVATVGGWTLGTTAGAQVLTASAGAAAPVRIHATAVAGAAAKIQLANGNGQRAAAGSAVAVAPAVVVQDQYGNVVEGVVVTFTVTRGGGSVSGAAAVSDANGVARAGSWTMGEAGGLNVLDASSGVGSASFFANARPEPRPGFNIDLHFTTLPRAAYVDGVLEAAAKWEAVITGDLPSESVAAGDGTCGSGLPGETVDDIVIVVDFDSIDGPLKILGRAGPCWIRELLPAFGALQLDTADLQLMETQGIVRQVFLHEMGHILGIGTLWCVTSNPCQNSEFMEGNGNTEDAYFIGANARNAFAEVGGAVYTGIPVPIEVEGGPGTAWGHWRESVMDNELMTGFIAAGSSPMSLVTIQSLLDMGYAVDRSQADAYTVPDPAAAARAGSSVVQRFQLRETNHRIPLYQRAPDGSVRRIR